MPEGDQAPSAAAPLRRPPSASALTVVAPCSPLLKDLDEEQLLAQIAELDPDAAAEAARATGSGAASVEAAVVALEAVPASPPASTSSAEPAKLNEDLLKQLERLNSENEAMKAGKLGAALAA